MPSRAIPPLHLYRHLLREATYLPKPCAPYVRQQITTRFRKHKKDDPQARLTKRRLRAAQSQLRSLHAANAGVIDDMEHILHLTLGRWGRRRRILMIQNFRTNPQPNDTRPGFSRGMPLSLPHQTLHHGQPLEEDWLDSWDLPKLAALAASQAKHTYFSMKPELKERQLKITEDEIPAENALGRPFGAKAARSKLRKWYKYIIDKLMAPLPRDEWEALGRLARGEEHAWDVGGPPPRRKMCGEAETTTTTMTKKKQWDWRVYAVEPVRSVERAQSRSMKARTGEEGEGPYGLGRAIGLHNYERERLWRRLYSRIWQATPTMELMEDGKKWKVEWGKWEQSNIPVAIPSQMAFFDARVAGSDADAELVKQRLRGGSRRARR